MEALVEDPGEPALERAGHRLADRARLEALDELGHEALHDQALGLVVEEAARAQVEDLLGIDLGDCRRVRAADVVGQDLQARDGIGVGLLGDQQVAALLEGVDALRAAGVSDFLVSRRSPSPAFDL